MKTILVSFTILILALFGTLALAQDDQKATPQEMEWAECATEFASMNKRYDKAYQEIIQAIQSGAVKIDAETCFLIVAAETVVAWEGDLCLDLGLAIPKDSPNKKFIKTIDKQIAITVKSFQKVIARDQKFCQKLQEKEDAQKKDTQRYE